MVGGGRMGRMVGGGRRVGGGRKDGKEGREGKRDYKRTERQRV